MPSKTRRSSPSFSRHVAPFAPLALALAVGAASHGGQTSTSALGETAETGFAQLCTNPHYPTDSPTVMDSTSCSVSGNGGAETWQNEAKNNFCAPGLAADPGSSISTSIPELTALQGKVQQISGINFGNTRQHPLTSKAGPIQNRAPLIALGEGSMVQLQGYVKIARQEGAESVNCGSHVPNQSAYHDIHISIVQNSSDQECSGVVVEMTPHYRPATWTAALVNEVAAAGLLVRVTGQRMFDSSHSPCINGSPVAGDPARISLWELHPIYEFEVCPQGDCTSGGWVPLEVWKKS